MKRSILGIAIGIALLATRALAQDPQPAALKPMVVMVASSYQGLMADLQFIGKSLNDDYYVDRLNALVDKLFQTKGLKINNIGAIHAEKPLGFAIVTDGTNVIPISMIPLSGDAQQLFAALAPLLGPVQAEGEIFAVKQGPFAGHVKVQDGWAYFAQSPEHLAALPDPAIVFGTLPQSYDMAMQFNAQNIPEVFRDLAIDQLRVSLENVGAKGPDESDAQYAFRQQLGLLRSQLVKRGLGESESTTIGLTIDADQKNLRGEMIVRPLADSPLAAHLAELHDLKTRFGNVLVADEKAIPSLLMNMTGPLDKGSIDEYVGQVKAYGDLVAAILEKSTEVKSDEERTILKELAASMVEVARGSVESGNLDVAVQMVEKPQRSLVVAARAADGSKLQAVVDKIGELAKGDPGFASVQWNEADAGGVAIHSLKLKIEPKSQLEELAKLFDGEIKLSLAVKDDNLWFAVGKQGVDLIRRTLELNEVDTPPMQAKMKLAPILRMGGQLNEEPQLRSAIALLTTQLRGADHAQMTATVEDGSLVVRGEAGQGVVKLMGAVTQFAGLILDMQKSNSRPAKAK